MAILAFSSLCGKYIDDIFALARKSPYQAIEWDMNFIPPTLSEYRLNQIKQVIYTHGLKVRYHLPYSYIEMALVRKWVGSQIVTKAVWRTSQQENT